MDIVMPQLGETVREGTVTLSTGLASATNPGNLRVQLVDIPDDELTV